MLGPWSGWTRSVSLPWKTGKKCRQSGSTTGLLNRHRWSPAIWVLTSLPDHSGVRYSLVTTQIKEAFKVSVRTPSRSATCKQKALVGNDQESFPAPLPPPASARGTLLFCFTEF